MLPEDIDNWHERTKWLLDSEFTRVEIAACVGSNKGFVNDIMRGESSMPKGMRCVRLYLLSEMYRPR